MRYYMAEAKRAHQAAPHCTYLGECSSDLIEPLVVFVDAGGGQYKGAQGRDDLDGALKARDRHILHPSDVTKRQHLRINVLRGDHRHLFGIQQHV